MSDQKSTTGEKLALDDLADEALAVARSMPNCPAKTEALKKAGLLRKARMMPGFHPPESVPPVGRVDSR
jgi:hypothetical protein